MKSMKTVMKTYGSNDYALIFSSDYASILVKDLATGSILEDETIDLSEQVRFKYEDEAYVVEEGQNMDPAAVKIFEPDEMMVDGGIPEPLRFAAGGFIGSADLRDTRAYKDYEYDLEACEITLQFLAPGSNPDGTPSVPQVYVRTRCGNDECSYAHDDCLTVVSKPPYGS